MLLQTKVLLEVLQQPMELLAVEEVQPLVRLLRVITEEREELVRPTQLQVFL